MTDTVELVLRTLVFQFDGRVVEIFGGPNNETIRYHVALLKEPEVVTTNSKGRSLIKIGSMAFHIDADEMALLAPLLSTIAEAIRTISPSV